MGQGTRVDITDLHTGFGFIANILTNGSVQRRFVSAVTVFLCSLYMGSYSHYEMK